ncbi:MAG: hypothetical protein ACREC0_05310 [Methylocella sp.]
MIGQIATVDPEIVRGYRAALSEAGRTTGNHDAMAESPLPTSPANSPAGCS